MHEVHLRVLQAFMARPEFYSASPAIRNVFKEHYEAHLTLMQQQLGGMSDDAPYMEDAAEEAQATEQMNEQGGSSF